MSDKKVKRVNKTKEELAVELREKKTEDFKTALAELEEKYGYRLQPTLHYSQNGVIPTINVVEVPKEVKTDEEVVV
jgi:hypothetical protein